jgi:hypothetical protein
MISKRIGEIVLLLSLFSAATAMVGSRSIANYVRRPFAAGLMPANLWTHIDEALGN